MKETIFIDMSTFPVQCKLLRRVFLAWFRFTASFTVAIFSVFQYDV